MLDENYKAWLIEINTNPWIEESSKLLETYIPRVIDDALKLTIDVVFKMKNSGKETEVAKNKSAFSVPGYDDYDNLWEEVQI